MFCCGREKNYEHASCLPGLAQVFFSQSAVGLTQAPQLLSRWVPPLSHAFLLAAVINIDLNPDGQVLERLSTHLQKGKLWNGS